MISQLKIAFAVRDRAVDQLAQAARPDALLRNWLQASPSGIRNGRGALKVSVAGDLLLPQDSPSPPTPPLVAEGGSRL